MKRIILTVVISTAMTLWTVTADAEHGRERNVSLDRGLRIGVVLGEDFLKQAVPVVDKLAKEALPNVEGSILFRIDGKLVRVTKNSHTVIEILDDSGPFSGDSGEFGDKDRQDGWKKAEERKREGREKYQEKQREQAKRDAEREREARKRAAEKAREARKDREEWNRELRKSREERGEKTEADRQIRL